MRPCNNCGAPIENRLLYCEKCDGVATAKATQEDAQLDTNLTPERKSHLWFAAEITIRTMLCACPVAVILSLVLIMALPVLPALVIAVTVALFTGLGWTILEVYFQSGPH